MEGGDEREKWIWVRRAYERGERREEEAHPFITPLSLSLPSLSLSLSLKKRILVWEAAHMYGRVPRPTPPPLSLSLFSHGHDRTWEGISCSTSISLSLSYSSLLSSASTLRHQVSISPQQDDKCSPPPFLLHESQITKNNGFSKKNGKSKCQKFEEVAQFLFAAAAATKPQKKWKIAR